MRGYLQGLSSRLFCCCSGAALVNKLCMPVGLNPQLSPAFRPFSPRIGPKLCPPRPPTSATADYACDTTHSFSSPREKNEVTLKYVD